MELASEKIQKEITELLDNKEWTMRDKRGEIIFTPQAPKDMVERFRKLQKLIKASNLGVISDEEFDEELDEIYPEEAQEESTMENEGNDIELKTEHKTEEENIDEEELPEEAKKVFGLK